MTTIQHAFIETRGAPYRRVRTLELSPSANVAQIAEGRLRALLSTGAARLLPGAVRKRLEDGDAIRDADWATYLLFDGEFAEALHQLGRADGLSQADTIRAFFEDKADETEGEVNPPDRLELPELPPLPGIASLGIR
jgi:hypothetical protein